MNKNDFFMIKSLADNMNEALTALRSQVAELEANISKINDNLDSTYSKNFFEKTQLSTRLAEVERKVETETKKNVKAATGVKIVKKPSPVVKNINAPFVRKKINTNDKA